MPKIAVYAGHGGNDPGAVSGGLKEKDLNLAVSNALSEILRGQGYDIINNRTGDMDRSITADANLANNEKVDALIEIHQNSNPGIPSSGTETYYSVKDTGKGKQLAEAINNNIVALGYADRGIKTRINENGQDEFGIIRLTNAPAVLVETSFINSPEDMARFNAGELAEAIAKAVNQVFPVQ